MLVLCEKNMMVGHVTESVAVSAQPTAIKSIPDNGRIVEQISHQRSWYHRAWEACNEFFNKNLK